MSYDFLDDVLERVLGSERDGFLDTAEVSEVAALEHTYSKLPCNFGGDVLSKDHWRERVVVWLSEHFIRAGPGSAVLDVRPLVHLQEYKVSYLDGLGSFCAKLIL